MKCLFYQWYGVYITVGGDWCVQHVALDLKASFSLFIPNGYESPFASDAL